MILRMHTVGSPLLWGIFAIAVVIMLVIDLMIQGRTGDKSPSMKQTVLWSLLWILLALIFNILFFSYLLYTESHAVANSQALAFLTGYLLEKALAADNVFIWLTLFNYSVIPLTLQHRLLTWGILGAVGLRTVMVFTGSWLINEFKWLFYFFGLFLLFIGIKMILPVSQHKKDIGSGWLMQWLCDHLRISSDLCGNRFFIRRNGLLFGTPLLLSLIMVEFSDIVLSLDSIPAIFAVTTDPFIVLTSNLFAVLGLRAMYFLLANIAERFSLLKYGLAIILMFIGIKMLVMDLIHIPVAISLATIVSILIITLFLNALVNQRKLRFIKRK